MQKCRSVCAGLEIRRRENEMKILLIVDQFDNGNNGTTMTSQRLYEGLKELGHEVRVVSTGERRKDK